MKRWLAVLGAGIIAGAAAYMAVNKADDMCEHMEQDILLDLGNHVACDKDADCALTSGLACPWTPCSADNIPVRASRQVAVGKQLKRFSLCTHLPHFRKLAAACEAMKPRAICAGRTVHNAACIQHRCIVW